MKILILFIFSVVSVNGYCNLPGTSPNGKFFVSLNEPVLVNDAFGPLVYKVNVKSPYYDAYQNYEVIDYTREAFFIDYGGQLGVLQVNGKVMKYFAKDLNADSWSELVVEYLDEKGIYHLKAYSSGAHKDENRGFIDMVSLNKVAITTSEKDGFLIDVQSGVIKTKMKDVNGKETTVNYKISDSFDFNAEPVLLLRERLR